MFTFKLQSVLDVRKTMEEKAVSQFSEQQQALQKEKDAFHVIQAKKRELVDALKQIQGTTVNVLEITMNSEWIKQCRENELIQQERLREAKIRVDTKRKDLIEAIKQRKAMELLKSKHLEEYKSNVSILERAATDEMVIVRYNRGKEK
jgi:flagellar protein FliJ